MTGSPLTGVPAAAIPRRALNPSCDLGKKPYRTSCPPQRFETCTAGTLQGCRGEPRGNKQQNTLTGRQKTLKGKGGTTKRGVKKKHHVRDDSLGQNKSRREGAHFTSVRWDRESVSAFSSFSLIRNSGQVGSPDGGEGGNVNSKLSWVKSAVLLTQCLRTSKFELQRTSKCEYLPAQATIEWVLYVLLLQEVYSIIGHFLSADE